MLGGVGASDVADRPAGRRPQVVAHRGASHDEPEHTLGAYRRAIEAGADALECDVRLTRDGHLVCVHDRRVERTSNGRGLVSRLELTELEGLDWASWKRGGEENGDGGDGGAQDGDELPDRDRGRLLTLRRLLATVADADRRVEVAVETKHPTRWAGAVERELVDLLDTFGWAHPPPGTRPQVRVMSFSRHALKRVRHQAPRLPLVWLRDRVPKRYPGGDLPRGVGTAGVRLSVLREYPDYVRRVQRVGSAVHVWTVNQPADVRRCVQADVDAIITDRPDMVLAELARTPFPAAPRPARPPRLALTARPQAAPTGASRRPA